MKKYPLLLAVAVALGLPLASRADEYDTLRARWKGYLVDYSPLTTSDPDIAASVRELADDARSLWNQLNKSPSTSNPHLFASLPITGGTPFQNNLNLNRTYSRLLTIARGYATANCVSSNNTTITGNPTIATDLKRALDWIYSQDYFSPNTPFPSDRSGFYIKINIPLTLHDICVLLYDTLTTTQLNNYTDSTAAFFKRPNVVEESGGNKVWIDTNHALYGVLRKDASELAFARDYLSDHTNGTIVTPSVLNYTDWTQNEKTGFYTDGSFIQHDAHPYTGGYGATLIFNLARILGLLDGSTWTVTDPDRDNVLQWVYDAYEPVIYRGAIVDSLRGREISRQAKYDHVSGHLIMEGLLRLASFAPEPHATNYLAMVRAWIEGDPRTVSRPAGGSFPAYAYSRTLYADSTPPSIALAKSYTGAARRELLGHFAFPNMNRAMHLRPGWGFGLSLFSDRIYNYESLQPLPNDPTAPVENKRGYFTGDGMTTLYNADVAQFSDAFWPTINPSRLPGITVDTLARHAGSSVRQYNAKNWVGGAHLDYYGVAAMDFDAPNHTWDDPSTPGTNPDINQSVPLVAKKAWFMFDDEVVALGAAITGPAANVTNGGWDGANPRIETIIENRRLTDAGLNPFLVNGSTQLSGFSSTEAGSSFASATRAHLTGNVGGDDVGYYFPGGVTLKAARFARTGSWPGINDNASDSTVYTRNYLSLWLDHGSSPNNATYAYAILPGRTSSETNAYATSPQFTVVKNDATAQVVEETTLGVTAAALWIDGSTSWLNNLVKADKKAAIVVDKNSADIDVGVAEPTFAYTSGTNTMTVELNQAATAAIHLDPALTLVQLSPTIKFTFPLAHTFGRTHRAKFQTGALEFINESFNAQTLGVAPSGWTITGSGALVAAVPSSSDRSVHLNDTSTASLLVLAKSFAPQNGAIMAEYRMRAEQTNKALDAGALREASDTSNNSIGPRVIFRATGKITYYDGLTSTDTDVTYSAGTWYRFRIIANPDRQRYSLWIDDVLKASDVSFYTKHPTLDRITFGTVAAADTAAAHVDNVVVRRYVPIVEETFSGQTVGRAPSGWSVAGTGNTGTIASPPSTSDSALKLVDTSSTYGVEASRSFTAQTAGTVTVDFRARAEQTNAWIKLSHLSDGSSDGVQVLFDTDGKIKYYHANTKTDSGLTYTAGTWYHFRIVADVTTDRFALWINGVNVATAANFRNALASISKISFGVSTTTAGTAFIDDVRIYR